MICLGKWVGCSVSVSELIVITISFLCSLRNLRTRSQRQATEYLTLIIYVKFIKVKVLVRHCSEFIPPSTFIFLT